jgi:2-hydroxy-3-keto-5-methylthiopentenyl-1-phosphate phosphatase
MSSRKLPRPQAKCRVLIDFDGTIAPDDATDRILERFADPAWREIEDAWLAGRISSRECMERQVQLLRASPAELDEVIGQTRIDPAFPAFLKLCRSRGLETMVVSDGFDRVIRAVLASERLAVPFFANKLEWCGGDRWRLAFPHAQSRCRVTSANCKCSHGIEGAVGKVVAVGDGRSDFCMSTRANFVIAKGALARFCRDRNLAHAEFEDFEEAGTHLARWLAVDALEVARIVG